MTPSDFDKLLSERYQEINSVLGNKAKEYSTDNDRLHNFKKLAQFMDITPEQSCMSLLMKNFIALRDVVAYDKDITFDYWKEKIGDTINYLILLDAIWKERHPDHIAKPSEDDLPTTRR